MPNLTDIITLLPSQYKRQKEEGEEGEEEWRVDYLSNIDDGLLEMNKWNK